MSFKQEARRKQIYEFYLNNRSEAKKYTIDYFLAAKIPRQTISDTIKRAENNLGHERVSGSGRVAKIMTKTNIKRIKNMFEHRDGVSTRQASRKFEFSQSLIVQTLVSRTSIRIHKKKKIPMRKDSQLQRISICCDRLYRKLQDKSVILDDESYFTLTHSTINGNDNFYSSNIQETPSSVKYRKVSKFEQKILVWIAFSSEGISEPFFVPSGLAINQKVYLRECIQKRLIPFINEHHSNDKYLFWPDLASSHYANTVTGYIVANKVNFVK